MKINDLRSKHFGVGLLTAGILAVLLISGATAKAQDNRDEAKPQQEEPKKDEAKPQQKEEPRDMKPQHEEAPARSQEAKPEKNEKQERVQQGHVQESHAAQRGQKIPDEKFRSSFGRQHTFHVQKTVIVEGQPRFQYGGYWFQLATPWPDGWAYTDDCYLDFIDGEYVLIDLLHPGAQIVVVVIG